jgi:hypothetical protein
MGIRLTWLSAIALLALVGPARAQVKDAADLLPAETLACVELRHPDRLAREAAALVRGSAVENLPAALARLRERMPPDQVFWSRSEVEVLGLFFSPEMIAEAGRIQGGFVAFTGIARDGMPEIVGALQSGTSNFPGLYMRGMLSFSNVFIVGEAEGIPLFRERSRVWQMKVPKGAAPPPPPMPKETGPIMAMPPGMLVFGSTVESVKALLRRARGKDAGPTLGSVSAYKEAAALRDRPGLFAYADLQALTTQMDELAKKPENRIGREWDLLKAVVKPGSFRNATAALTLVNGTLELSVRANLADRPDNPLLAVLPRKAAATELLHFLPRGALAGITMGQGDGEKRWEAVLALVDAVARVNGAEDNLPSKSVRELEEKVGLRVGKDVLARLSGLAASFEVDKEMPGGLVVLRCVDEKAAQFLEERGLPRLLALALGGEGPVPERAEVEGKRITSLAGKLPPGMALHYGRSGSVLVIGQEPSRVVRTLVAGTKKEGLPAEPKVEAVLKEIEGPRSAVGIVAAGRALMAMVALGSPKVINPPGAAEEPNKILQQLNRVVEAMPPLAVTLAQQPAAVTLEVRQTGLRRTMPRLLDVWVESALERSMAGRNPFGPGAPADKIEEKKVEKKEEKKIEKKEEKKR